MSTTEGAVIVGKIKSVGETQTVGNNGFKKRDIVVVTDEKYPQTILIEFTQDKCELLNTFKPDELVRIDTNIKGREWFDSDGREKYFNSIQGWRIKRK